MKHELEDPRTFNTTYSLTGEKVKYVRRKCKCGHTLNFMSRNKARCTHCGRVVYPDEKYEFQERMLKELRK